MKNNYPNPYLNEQKIRRPRKGGRFLLFLLGICLVLGLIGGGFRYFYVKKMSGRLIELPSEYVRGPFTGTPALLHNHGPDKTFPLPKGLSLLVYKRDGEHPAPTVSLRGVNGLPVWTIQMDFPEDDFVYQIKFQNYQEIPYSQSLLVIGDASTNRGLEPVALRIKPRLALDGFWFTKQ